MIACILALIILFTTVSAYANGIAPEFIAYWGLFYSTVVFTIGFALEYGCMCILARTPTTIRYWDAFKCTLFMNLMSTFFGAIFRVAFSVMFALFVASISNPSHLMGLIIGSGIFFIYVSINTLIEVWTPLHYFWPLHSKKEIWLWTFIANCLSMGAITLALFAGTLPQFVHFIAGR